VTLGVVLLCHTAFDRAAQVARHWSAAGCPVVIHLDRRVPEADRAGLAAALADLPSVRFSARVACEWGTFSLVQATINAATQMLAEFPEVRHVYLASGSCVPIRPVKHLQEFLAAHPETDFIESVTTADVGWTVGGLNKERFTLRFPFSWKRQRALFDGYVRLQRKVGFERKIPNGLVPHLGSQWWCLTRRSLEQILSHPDRQAHDRFFRRVWIPDESYFQTLIRKVSTRVESRSLTLSKFDFQGRPHLFYDDHLHLLRQSEAFVARKIWPEADLLYRTFLSDQPPILPTPNPGKIDRLFAKATERRVKGRPGLYMQSRLPTRQYGGTQSAAPYGVIEGLADLFEDFPAWLARAVDARVHGHLFALDRVQFAGGDAVFKGGLSDSASLRDYDPRSFLTNLIWNTRGETQCFMFGPGDVQDVAEFMASDPQARIFIVSGAFAVRLWRSGRPVAEIRPEAARLQKIEADLLALLDLPETKARVHRWTLAEFVESPAEPLLSLMSDLDPHGRHPTTELPKPVPLIGFGAFLQELRNQGMQPVLMGDFPKDFDLAANDETFVRPKLVK
jgi:hypothetical protein